MLSFLKTILDLPRDARTASSWLLVLLLLVEGDAYLILRFDQSLMTFLQKEPAQMSAFLGQRWPKEALMASAATVATWFYFLPIVIVPSWRAMLHLADLHLPEWIWSTRQLSRKAGWRWVIGERRRAVVEKNAMMLAECDARRSAAVNREFRLRCTLGILMFTAAAACFANETTGASLSGELLNHVEQLPRLLQLLLCFAMLPAIAVTVSVLTDKGAEFDEYINVWHPE
jgi:hypothetical protein